MRRFIILLLLCVLPLQFALAAGVDARLHAGSAHHHEAASHSDEVTSELTVNPADTDGSSSRFHGECGDCHLCHSVAMFGMRADLKRPAAVASIDPSGRDAQHLNAASERPERPNWSALV
jgi:hypothetical protein